MTKTRFIAQKAVLIAMIIASVVTMIPFVLIILEHMTIKDKDESLYTGLEEMVKTKYEEI